MANALRKHEESNSNLQVVPLNVNERAEKVANIYLELLKRTNAFSSLNLETPKKNSSDQTYLIVEKGRGWGFLSSENIIADLKFDGQNLDILNVLIPLTEPKYRSKEEIVKSYEEKIFAILNANKDFFPKLRENRNFNEIKQGLLTLRPPLYMTLTQWKIDKFTSIIIGYLKQKYGELSIASGSDLVGSSRTKIVLENQSKNQIATIEFITPSGQISFDDNVAIAININSKDDKKTEIIKEGKLKALASELSKELFKHNKHVSVSLG